MKKLSYTRKFKNKFSLTIDDIAIAYSDMRGVKIDEDNIIITIKLPKDLYYINKQEGTKDGKKK